MSEQERCSTCGNQLWRGDVYQWWWEEITNALGQSLGMGCRIFYEHPDYDRPQLVAERVTKEQAVEICKHHNMQFHDMEPLDSNVGWSDEKQGVLFE